MSHSISNFPFFCPRASEGEQPQACNRKAVQIVAMGVLVGCVGTYLAFRFLPSVVMAYPIGIGIPLVTGGGSYLIYHEIRSRAEKHQVAEEARKANIVAFSKKTPATPEKSYPIDSARVKELTDEMADSDAKRIFLRMVEVTQKQHITFSMLKESLSSCVDQLNQLLKARNSPPYALGIEKDKSAEWVAQLAWPQLETQPRSIFDLRSSSEIPQEKTVVIFDECSYSGKKIYAEWIDPLCRASPKVAKKLHVILVIPFMSQCAHDVLRKLGDEGIDISVITSERRIRNIQAGHENDILTGSELQLIRSFARMGKGIMPNQTLCYTDWRYPDGTSFPPEFGRGMEVPVRSMYIDDDIFYINEESNFIPPIPRIYGKTRDEEGKQIYS
ncbi:MAG: hypothetical protein KR126chlam2_01237 [Chlamydiae bacterium]|nr:hypothetical protein [Chlamydiota bacterium]